jgi:hypothetical protein
MTHCLIPVSIGELYDKYSILEIKCERIKDLTKLEFVKREMDYLKPFIDEYRLEETYRTQLKSINANLWDIEDRIRVKESLQEFDQEFISIARSVYKTNDERNIVKNQINDIFKSDIKDIKSYVQ